QHPCGAGDDAALLLGLGGISVAELLLESSGLSGDEAAVAAQDLPLLLESAQVTAQRLDRDAEPPCGGDGLASAALTGQSQDLSAPLRDISMGAAAHVNGR